jgi:putative transposase
VQPSRGARDFSTTACGAPTARSWRTQPQKEPRDKPRSVRSHGTAIAKAYIWPFQTILLSLPIIYTAMSKVLALYHIVFATQGRYPALHDANRLDLHRVISNIVADKNCRMVSINSVTDHLHMLINLSPSISLKDFISAVKSKSSTWLKQDSRTTMFTSWCKGYYACTVSPSMMQKTIKYIESQTEHHRLVYFDTEIMTMCQHLGLTFHPDDMR